MQINDVNNQYEIKLDIVVRVYLTQFTWLREGWSRYFMFDHKREERSRWRKI